MPQLHTLLHLHLAPIVAINGSSCRDLTSGSRIGDFCCLRRAGCRCLGFFCVQSLPSKYEWESTHPGVGFLLRCFQQLSAPHLATQRLPRARQLVHQRCVLPGPLVLGKGPLNALAPAPDMDRTVSRRSEPSSRTALMGEQPNPWDVLPPQVAKSRHRGAKPSRRCELLGKISLLSLE